MKIAFIAGAGFSKSAGLPLTFELFNEVPHEPSPSEALLARHADVQAKWAAWQALNPGKGPEQWMTELYLARSLSADADAAWWNTLRFVTARLATIRRLKTSKAQYYDGILTSIKEVLAAPHCEAHLNLWERLHKSGALSSIITTNYDLLIEQGFRELHSEHRIAPLCHYGGIIGRQSVKKITRLIGKTPEAEEVVLDGPVPLYKLHGSLNWTVEPGCGLMCHGDSRAPFWIKRQTGDVLIVPPIKEKQTLVYFQPIWERAKIDLSESDTWIVCGYSMPHYDHAIRKMLKEAAATGPAKTIWLIDPDSERLTKYFSKKLSVADVRALPALADALTLHHWP